MRFTVESVLHPRPSPPRPFSCGEFAAFCKIQFLFVYPRGGRGRLPTSRCRQSLPSSPHLSTLTIVSKLLVFSAPESPCLTDLHANDVTSTCSFSTASAQIQGSCSVKRAGKGHDSSVALLLQCQIPPQSLPAWWFESLRSFHLSKPPCPQPERHRTASETVTLTNTLRSSRPPHRHHISVPGEFAPTWTSMDFRSFSLVLAPFKQTFLTLASLHSCGRTA